MADDAADRMAVQIKPCGWKVFCLSASEIKKEEPFTEAIRKMILLFFDFYVQQTYSESG